ncbi:PTS sugar transporter subunit IIA [Staphylococcus simulans]|uniref:PTS sugar transporter subunit IIA n=1 Tax=Staphylococcus simulans TaxID=1286 RepID=UPI000D1EE0BF|nr:PTS sugar transporter subunit IIA [Staphylococcus simulans]MDY5060458.1 PTS sugar transporter subunit IIA [Staphylococcus simulans]PTI97757.1 PTS ascorbate transporter subunit IIA [Staphylococcus simulans]PTJ20234.1 PTS ascorbate transporter subunit IIA [Staphylococcus simulans]PTJ49695.1 PTS ascorbate transporter subunit IIA [Staphylococcus simulans]RIN55665.1 PTS sugar transporter subunit IIA [Staphylococcus simulans]
MALDILTKDKIKVQDQVPDWSQAITEAAQPLLEQDYIETGYIDAMIDSVKEFGPYIVIAPEIAIAHARPEDNVNKVGLSLLKLNESINFAEDSHYASLIFVLSATDNTSHLNVLQSLAGLLGNKEVVNQLLESKNSDEIIEIIKEND